MCAKILKLKEEDNWVLAAGCNNIDEQRNKVRRKNAYCFFTNIIGHDVTVMREFLTNYFLSSVDPGFFATTTLEIFQFELGMKNWKIMWLVYIILLDWKKWSTHCNTVDMWVIRLWIVLVNSRLSEPKSTFYSRVNFTFGAFCEEVIQNIHHRYNLSNSWNIVPGKEECSIFEYLNILLALN